MTTQDTDRVIIRQYHGKSGAQWITAFLPDEPANPGFIMSYAHLGQHGEASIGYYDSLAPIDYNAPEVQDLIAELKSIGYNVRLMKRLNRPFGGWAK